MYVAARVSARYVIRFRARDGRKTKLMFRITSAKLRTEFNRRLRENRDAAARYANPDRATGRPDPISSPRPPAWPRVALLTAVFVVTAGALTAGGVALYGALADLPGGGPFGPAAHRGRLDDGPGPGPEAGDGAGHHPRDDRDRAGRPQVQLPVRARQGHAARGRSSPGRSARW